MDINMVWLDEWRPKARSGHVAAHYRGTLHIFGGYNEEVV